MMLRFKTISIFLLVIHTVFGRNVEVPSVVVAEVGQDAVFRCGSLDAVNVEWRINGTSLTSLQISDVVQSFDSVAGLGAVRFRNVPVEYNGTIVQCIVNTTSEIVQEPNSTLLLQGTLSAVGDLIVSRVSGIDPSTVFLNWTAPFTLEFTFTNSDIMYCVDVVSSTSSATLHSECGITETEFTYPLPSRSWCHEYNFTVTPVNVVGNGTKRSETQHLFVPNRIEKVSRLNSTYTIVMSAPVCTASLWCVDLDDAKGAIHIENADLHISETNVTFTSQQLRPNRRYAINITAANIRGNGTDSSQRDPLLSTHDITECSTNSTSDGVEVFVRFVDSSTATGALVSFVFMEDEEIDFSKSFVRAVNKTDLSHGHMISIHNFSPGNYVAFFYDIESDGRIPNGTVYQASRGRFVVASDQEPTVPPASSSCNVSSLSGVISVSCTFDFQVTVQLRDIDVVANLIVHTCTDSDPATIPVPENGTYLVTILRIIGEKIMSELPFSYVETVMDVPTTQGPTVSATEMPDKTPGTFLAIAAAAATSLVFLAFAMTMTATCFIYKSRRKTSRPIMFIAGEGVHRTCSISYQKKSGPTVFSTPEMYDTYSIGQDSGQEQASEDDVDHESRSTSSFSIQEQNSKRDDYSGHVYSKVKKTHTPTSTTVVALVKSSPPSDSFGFVTIDTDVAQPSQTSTELTDGHYSTVDHGSTRPAEMNPSCEDSTYSVPMKYQNSHGQQYSLLKLKKSNNADKSFEISRSVHKVQYSEVRPAQNLLKGPEPRDPPASSQQDQTQTEDGNKSGDPFRWKHDEDKIPLIDSHGVRVF